MGQAVGWLHLAMKKIMQCAALGILHNKVCGLLIGRDAVQCNYIGMLDARQLFDLLLDVLLLGAGKELLDSHQLIAPCCLADNTIGSMADFL